MDAAGYGRNSLQCEKKWYVSDHWVGGSGRAVEECKVCCSTCTLVHLYPKSPPMACALTSLRLRIRPDLVQKGMWQAAHDAALLARLQDGAYQAEHEVR